MKNGGNKRKYTSYPSLLFSPVSLVHLASSCTVNVCLRHIDTHHCSYEQYYVCVVQKAFRSQLCLDVGHSVTRSNFTVHSIICTHSTSISFLIVCEKCVVCVVNEFHEYNVEGGGGVNAIVS